MGAAARRPVEETAGRASKANAWKEKHAWAELESAKPRRTLGRHARRGIGLFCSALKGKKRCRAF